jgi:hypothetical protein
MIHEHLEAIGHVERLGLLLYTRGGDTLVPLRLVSLLREYCKQLHVYVPFRAHSAGTMICLGADTVHMSPLGELSPIDPTVSSPIIPKVEGANVGIGIEDVISYLQLAEERTGLRDQQIKVQVFLKLAEQVTPIALGNINRTYLGIRSIASELLSLRAQNDLQDHEQTKLIDFLTTKLYFHDRPITRGEAKKIGMKFVADPDPALDGFLIEIQRQYGSDLDLSHAFNPAEILKDKTTETAAITAALVESTSLCHAFVFEGTITKILQPPPNVPPGINIPNFAVRWLKNQWQQMPES